VRQTAWVLCLSSAAFFGETDVGGPLDEGGDALVIPFVRIHKEGDLDLTSRESAA